MEQITTQLPGSRLPGESVNAWAARVFNAGWVPANGGTEQPQVLGGKRVLYVTDLKLGRHAYLDLDSDMILDEVFIDRLWKIEVAKAERAQEEAAFLSDPDFRAFMGGR